MIRISTKTQIPIIATVSSFGLAWPVLWLWLLSRFCFLRRLLFSGGFSLFYLGAIGRRIPPPHPWMPDQIEEYAYKGTYECDNLDSEDEGIKFREGISLLANDRFWVIFPAIIESARISDGA
jgi:hypothetical protein